MMRYEALMLTVPEITQDETRTLESQVETVIKNNGASLLSFERWGKYRLAYPVKKNEYGVYFLVRFEAEKVAELLPAMRTLFAVKFNDLIMRSMIDRLPNHGSLEYQKPHSLEDAPVKEMNPFAKEGRESRGFQKNQDSEDSFVEQDNFEEAE